MLSPFETWGIFAGLLFLLYMFCDWSMWGLR